MLDLPQPLGPTTAVTPGSKRSVVGSAKDLKPCNFRALRYMKGMSLWACRERGQTEKIAVVRWSRACCRRTHPGTGHTVGNRPFKIRNWT